MSYYGGKAPQPWRPELKFIDSFIVDANVLNNGTTSGKELSFSPSTAFNSSTTGDGESQRDGRTIQLKSLTISGTVYHEAFSQAPPEADDMNFGEVFLSVILDTQCNGNALQSENVYVNPVADTHGFSSLMRNLKFSSRFQILWSKVLKIPPANMAHTVVPPATGHYQGVCVPFKFTVDLTGLTTTYTGEALGVAQIQDNAIQMIAMGTTHTFPCLLTANARIRFCN